MHKYDVWLDLECSSSGTPEVVCTVFGKLSLPVRPMVGESLTLWSGKDTPAHFNIVTVVGIQSVHYVATTIDEVAHHVRPGQDMAVVSTTVRCRPLQVASVADAQKVVAFLTAQHHFELDTYAVNKLEAS
jgi:hypothetical protein